MGDLQRLLEMYARWQQRIFPYGSFDDFIVKLEKVGSSATAKVGGLQVWLLITPHNFLEI